MAKPNLSRFDPMAISVTSPQHSNPHSKQPMEQRLEADHQTTFLQQQGFTAGLIKTVFACKPLYPKRCWILDNSVHMAAKDSHRVGGTLENIQGFRVSRWEELQDCVSYQVQMASIMQMPTRFALLNNPGPNIGPQYFSIFENNTGGNTPATLAREVQIARNVMANSRPFGPTPLSVQLSGLRSFISSIAQQLISNKHIIPIVIATQGLPTDEKGVSTPEARQQFINTINAFRGFPVCILFRLCSDDEHVLRFYNSIDAQSSLRLDVIDDYFGESLEVYLRNPWLTYALPLHRFRELGFYAGFLDAIDERGLTADEVRQFCSFLFGIDNPLPDPKTNWNAFFGAVSYLISKEKQQWNPVSRKLAPWINLTTLQRIYGVGGSSTVPRPTLYSPQGQGIGQHKQTHQRPYQRQHFTPQQNNPKATHYWQPQVPPQHQPQTPSSTTRATKATSSDTVADNASLKKRILMKWALDPPKYKENKSLPELLGTIEIVFPEHDYFKQWKPLSMEALTSGEQAVVKRAYHKSKFLLHPDKLPRDLSEQQLFISKLLWDTLADAWEPWEKFN